MYKLVQSGAYNGGFVVARDFALSLLEDDIAPVAVELWGGLSGFGGLGCLGDRVEVLLVVAAFVTG